MRIAPNRIQDTRQLRSRPPKDSESPGASETDPEPPTKWIDKPDLKTLFNVRSFSTVAWAPDGKRFVFQQGGTHLQKEDGSVSRLFSGKVRDLEWLSDQALLVTRDQDGDEKNQLYLYSFKQEKPALIDLSENPKAIHRFSFKRGTDLYYSSNARNGKDFDFYRLDGKTMARECILEGAGAMSMLSPSPDGRQILVSQGHSNVNNDLFLFDVASKGLKKITAHEGNAEYSAERWVDDRTVLATSNQGREFKAPGLLDVQTGAFTALQETRWDTELLTLSPDGKKVAYSLNEDGYSRLYLYDLENRQPLPAPDLPKGVLGQLDFRGNDVLSILMSTSTRPNSLGLVPVAGGEIRWLKEATFETEAGTVDPRGFVEPELVHYPSVDGTQIPAWLYRPQGQPMKAAVVDIHGGPESQTRPVFNPITQHLLDQGIGVLAPNIRGSLGYGQAYADADNIGKRPDAIADAACSADYLRQIGVDANRIAIMGGSYGGYMALACLAFRPEVKWAAGVDRVGISNLETFMANTGPWRRENRAQEYGDPVRDQEVLRRWSPLHQVDKIEAPLMIIQGANDPRVPQSEADQMVKALQERGKPVEYQLFADEGHGVSKPENRLECYTKVTEFLKRNLGLIEG